MRSYINSGNLSQLVQILIGYFSNKSVGLGLVADHCSAACSVIRGAPKAVAQEGKMLQTYHRDKSKPWLSLIWSGRSTNRCGMAAQSPRRSFS